MSCRTFVFKIVSHCPLRNANKVTAFLESTFNDKYLISKVAEYDINVPDNIIFRGWWLRLKNIFHEVESSRISSRGNIIYLENCGH